MKHRIFLLIAAMGLIFSACEKNTPITIFMAGDSTAQTYRPHKTVQRGWAQFLPLFFDENVHFENRAIAGRSSKSFRNEGRWDKILSDMKAGDVVLIQFGHNDSSTKPERHSSLEDYRNNLSTFVHEVRERGGYPVLLTSIVLCTFDENGNVEDRRLKDYPKVMREVAQAENVPLIDLFQKTFDLLQSLGQEQSKKMYLYVIPGEDPAKPQGRADDTHLRERGALVIADLAVQAIREQKIKPLCRYLSDKVVLASSLEQEVLETLPDSIFQQSAREMLSMWQLEAEAEWDSVLALSIDSMDGRTHLAFVDGALHMQTPKGATLWYKRRFQGNIRISYEACVVDDACPYDRLSDLNCFWMAVDPEHPFDLFAQSDFRQGVFNRYYHLNMYYLGYGGNRNTTTRFRRYEGNMAAVTDQTLRPAILTEYTDSKHLLQANKWYRIAVEVLDGRVRYYRNGELLVDFNDPSPYDEGYMGFRTTQSHTAIRNFLVEFIKK